MVGGIEVYAVSYTGHTVKLVQTLKFEDIEASGSIVSLSIHNKNFS